MDDISKEIGGFKNAEQLIADRTKGLDLNPHPTQQKQRINWFAWFTIFPITSVPTVKMLIRCNWMMIFNLWKEIL
ncbi:hypothetical protein [Gracilibacillus thailandensis]|uniref:Uncharacterized protein n=1 Tax=Gracilibacillus thailandensis TaxID=563735 RepID=A0A6N7R690_9BACI|nr:hypothetical protein [Gracilibacillus thailandensis]MRI68745.1 hypothetical protein [Gracilibacillus thailandensis]